MIHPAATTETFNLISPLPFDTPQVPRGCERIEFDICEITGGCLGQVFSAPTK